MGVLIIAAHLSGVLNVHLDVDIEDERPRLAALLQALAPEITSLETKLRAVSLDLDLDRDAPDLAAAPTKAGLRKRGRPRGAATGFDADAKRRIVRQARRLARTGRELGGRSGPLPHQ